MSTTPTPTVPKTLLERVCYALDVKPRELGRRLNLNYHYDIMPLIGLTTQTRAELDRDTTWLAIAAYVDDRLGGLMAIRREMTNAMEAEHARRTSRVASQLERTKRSSPRL